LFNYQEAINTADIIAFLVGHKEFKGYAIKHALDFCGINHGEK
jgi:hypothetical protein